MEWFFFTLLAFLGFGLQDFLYKVATSKGCEPSLTTISFLLTVSLLSFFLGLILGLEITQGLIAVALANGILFSITTITRLEALKKIPASIVFTIIRMSLIIVVLWALLFAGETITIKSGLGILFSFIAIYLLKGEKK